jgi:small subunit ribosomal protein S17
MSERGIRKVRIGRVVSDSMDKSITVAVVRKVKHPIYSKYYQSTKKYMVHDEVNDAHVGDMVSITECRPLSRRKRWRLTEILDRKK